MNHDSLDYGYLLLRTNFWEIEWQDIPILKKSKIRCLWKGVEEIGCLLCNIKVLSNKT